MTSLRNKFLIPLVSLALALSALCGYVVWDRSVRANVRDHIHAVAQQQRNADQRMFDTTASNQRLAATAAIALASEPRSKVGVEAALANIMFPSDPRPQHVTFTALDDEMRVTRTLSTEAGLSPVSERVVALGATSGWFPIAATGQIAADASTASRLLHRSPVITPDRRHIGWFDVVYAADVIRAPAAAAASSTTSKERSTAVILATLAALLPLAAVGALLAWPLSKTINAIDSLGAAAERFKLGAPINSLPILRRDELGRIARAIAAMSSQASAIVDTEKAKSEIGSVVSAAQQEALEKQRAALARSMEQVRQFAAVVEAAYEGIIILDRRFRIEYANPAFANDFRMPVSTLKGLRISDIFHAEAKQSIDHFEPVLDLGIVVRETVRCKRADSVELYAELTASPVRDESGAITGIVVVERDVTATVMSSELMTRQLLIDPLTEVWRRTALLTDLERRAARTERTTFSVLFIDLDGFKLINDRFGHEAGDTVLRAVGAVLKSQIREHDVVGRYGGDEFIIVVDDDNKESNARRIAQRVVAAIPTVTGLRYPDVRFAASVGVACFPRDADTVADLVRCADHAMYAAKRAGGSRLVSWADVKTKPSWNSTPPSAEVLTLRRRG